MVSMLDDLIKVDNKGYAVGLTWHGQKARAYSGPLAAVMLKLPMFDKVPFAFSNDPLRYSGLSSQMDLFRPPLSTSVRVNEYKDVILRRPQTSSDEPMPVGIVSKGYDLIQHNQALEWVREGLNGTAYGKWIDSAPSTLLMSDYGERIQISIDLGVGFTPSDKFPVSLRLVLSNSVEGSTALEMELYWLRLVCSNGMVIEDGQEYRQIHTVRWNRDTVAAYLKRQMPVVNNDQKQMQEHMTSPVKILAIEAWADKEVTSLWNVTTSARLLHICRTGCDAEVACFPGESYRRTPASKLPMKELDAVPGQPCRAETIYDVGQALSWLAQSPSTVQGQKEKLRQVHQLLSKLAG